MLLLQLLLPELLLIVHVATFADSRRSTGGRGEARSAANSSSAVTAVAAAAVNAAPSSRPAPALPVASTAASDSGYPFYHGCASENGALRERGTGEQRTCRGLEKAKNSLHREIVRQIQFSLALSVSRHSSFFSVSLSCLPPAPFSADL